MEFFSCITLGEARKLITGSLTGRHVKTEDVPLIASLGRVAAEDITAAEDLPPFSRSIVDGFAVVSRGTFGACEASPALFSVVGEVLMGEKPGLILRQGQAAAIPTGGMLPQGADAVVMLEYTERPDEETLLIIRPAAPLENVVTKGEDIKEGQTIVSRGKVINPADIGALAACGFTSLKVYAKPKAGILSTGDEVVDAAAAPKPGEIRDVNSYALSAMFEQMGCQAACYGIVKDSYNDLKKILEKAVNENDIVVVSGGSSVGARDHTVKVIEDLGGRDVLFHGLALKPGKPTILGTVGETLVFGLPGHPVAAMTVCGQLVKTAVDLLLGRLNARNFPIPARLTRNIASAPGREDFIRVKLTLENGEYLAEPILGKSGMISTITQADGLVCVPFDAGGLYAGNIVSVELLK